MDKKSIRIFLSACQVLALFGISNESLGQDHQYPDSCFYLAMFEDRSMFGPFIVMEVQFKKQPNVSSVYDTIHMLVARNGLLYSVMKANGLHDSAYTQFLVSQKLKKKPLVIPYKYFPQLSPYLIRQDQECSIKYSIEAISDQDKFIKAFITPEEPLSFEKRACLIYDLFKKRELVNTMSESGRYYVYKYSCR